jgi:hypothetical protein
MRRQAVGLLVAAQAAHREKEGAVEKARRLKHGWMVTIDDMVSMQAACQQVRALGTAASGPASTAADVASLVAGVSALAGRMLDRTAAATMRFADLSE